MTPSEEALMELKANQAMVLTCKDKTIRDLTLKVKKLERKLEMCQQTIRLNKVTK